MAYCLTYYQDLMRGVFCAKPVVHKSGVKACDWLLKNAKDAFPMPIQNKKKIKITKDNQVSIGYAFRGFVGRQMTPEEIEDYHNNNDSTEGLFWWKPTGLLVSKKRAEELEKNLRRMVKDE